MSSDYKPHFKVHDGYRCDNCNFDTSDPYRSYETYRYCDCNKYPNGKIIDNPTIDKGRMTDKGDYKCGVCVIEDTIRLLKLNERIEYDKHKGQVYNSGSNLFLVFSATF